MDRDLVANSYSLIIDKDFATDSVADQEAGIEATV